MKAQSMSLCLLTAMGVLAAGCLRPMSSLSPTAPVSPSPSSLPTLTLNDQLATAQAVIARATEGDRETSPSASPRPRTADTPVPAGAPVTKLPAQISEVCATAAAGGPFTTTVRSVLLTTYDGQEVRLNNLRWPFIGGDAFYTERQPNGVPTGRGVEVRLDYVTLAEFGVATPVGAAWPLTLTLTDGTVLHDNLGWKAREGLEVRGDTDLGSFETSLENVRQISVQRTTEPDALPSEPPPGERITITTQDGTTSTLYRACGLAFRSICTHGIMCCYGRELSDLPLVGGLEMSPKFVRSVELGPSDQATGVIPARITTVDGQTQELGFQPCQACRDTPWRIAGESALGRLEIPLPSVKQIQFGDPMSASVPVPQHPQESLRGPSGVLSTRDGNEWEVSGLVDRDEESLPVLTLKSGLHVGLGKIKEVHFGAARQDADAQWEVPVAALARDGQEISGAVAGDRRYLADAALGTIRIRADELDMATLQVDDAQAEMWAGKPEASSSGPSAKIVMRNGASWEVNPLVAGQPSDLALHLAGGQNVRFDKLTNVAFGDAGADGIGLTFTTVDGQRLTGNLVGPETIVGLVSLGFVELSTKDIGEIVFE
jgi:hypothetical protein